MAKREFSILVDDLEDYYELHREPEFTAFRVLALCVLLQGKMDAIAEAKGVGPHYAPKRVDQIVPPHPSRWLYMQACEDWCRAADVSLTAYRNAVLRACEKARPVTP